MATVISRSQLSHPDLGAAGGSGLHTSIANMYTTLGDNANSRYSEQTSIADSTTVEVDHNFGATIDQLDILIYSGTGDTKTQVLDYVDAGWVVAGKGGELSTVLEVTTPGSGGPHNFTVVVVDGRTMNKAAYQLLVNTPSNPVAETVETWFDDNKRGLIQDSSGGLQPLSFLGQSYTSSAANAVPGVNTLVRSDIGTVTVTMPSSIATYDVIMVTDAGRNANGNNITIGRNGNTINGLAEDYIIQENGGWVILIGDNTNSDWIVLAASQGSGSGQGFRNYFTNGSFESNVTDGVTTGGGTAPTVSADEATPLFDLRSARVTSGAGTGYADFEITGIDNAVLDGGINLGLTAYLRTDAVSVDDDWTVGIYNVTDAAYVGSSPQTNLQGDTQTVFRGTLVPESGKTYVLRVEFTDTTAAKFVDVDGLLLTPDSSTALTDIMQAWEQYTPVTQGFGTVSGVNIEYRRVADSIEVRGWFTLGTVTAAEAQIGLPTGLTVGGLSGDTTVVGQFGLDVASVGNTGYIMSTEGDTFVNLAEQDVRDASNTNPLVPRVASSGFPSSTRMSIQFTLPIAEWVDSQVNLITPNLLKSNLKARYTLVSSAFGAAVPIPYNVVQYNIGGITEDGAGTFTIPADGKYRIEVKYADSGAHATTGRLRIVTPNGTSETNDIVIGSGGQYNLVATDDFSKGDTFFATLINTGTGGQTANNSYLTIERIADIGAIEPVGFGLATTEAAGLVYEPDSDSLKLSSGNISLSGASGQLAITGASLSVTLKVPGRIAYALNFTWQQTAGGTAEHKGPVVRINGTSQGGTQTGLKTRDQPLNSYEPATVVGISDVLAAGTHTLEGYFYRSDAGVNITVYASSDENLTFGAWTI